MKGGFRYVIHIPTYVEVLKSKNKKDVYITRNFRKSYFSI